jgi:hypothetical protein
LLAVACRHGPNVEARSVSLVAPPAATSSSTAAALAPPPWIELQAHFARLEPLAGRGARGVATLLDHGDGVNVVIAIHGARPGAHSVSLRAGPDCGGAALLEVGRLAVGRDGRGRLERELRRPTEWGALPDGGLRGSDGSALLVDREACGVVRTASVSRPRGLG